VDLGEPGSTWAASWPAFDPALVVEETVTMVVQVDGKVRDKLEVPADIDEAGALETARASAGARRALDGREVVKEIVRAPKLVNLVTRTG
jgi:leucyl-tRNA synthetase